MKPDKRRVFAVGAPARRSRDGNGKIAAPVGPVTGRAVSRSEMEVFQTSKQNSLVMKPAVSSHSHYAPDVQGSGQSE